MAVVYPREDIWYPVIRCKKCKGWQPYVCFTPKQKEVYTNSVPVEMRCNCMEV